MSFLTQVVRVQAKHRRTGRKRRGQPPCVTACVRPDARREFSTDEKGCASRQSATDKGSASAGTDPVRQRGTDNSRESCVYAGISAAFIRAIWITYTVTPIGCFTPALFLVTDGDRILEFVVSTNRIGSFAAGLLNTVIYAFNLSGGGTPNSLNVYSRVSGVI